MKRSFFAFIIAILSLLLLLFGCSESYSLSFDREVYYVKEGESVTPKVSVRPAKNDYVITVANTTVASTADGKTLVGLKDGAQTVIRATSGKRTAEALLIVSDKISQEQAEYDIKKTYYVTFHVTNYELLGLESEELKTSPYLEGDVITEPLPLYTGYSTDGWYRDRAMTVRHETFDYPVSESIDLYCSVEMLDNPLMFNGRNEVNGLLYPNLPHGELTLPAEHNGAAVPGIADEAFQNDTLLTGVVIPDSYTYIGKHAFSGCTALKKVVVGEHSSLEEIGDFAFSVYSTEDEEALSPIVDEACDQLSEFVIPDSVHTIGSFAFYGCSAYPANIPAALTKIQAGAFYGTKIKTAVLTNVTEIEAFAFNNCASLTAVTGTGNVVACAASVFNGSALYNAQINASPYVVYAGTILVSSNNGMTGKINLGKITLDANVTLIADGAFNGYNQSELTVTFPKSGILIGDDAFLDDEGVCLVVPDDELETYKTDNPYYSDHFCTKVIVNVNDENAVNFGTHTLLKFSETKYYYDEFTRNKTTEDKFKSPTEIDFSLLEHGQYITRLNTRAINLYTYDTRNNPIPGGLVTTLRLGRVASVGYMAVTNCAELKEIDLTGSSTIVSIVQGSFQFSSLHSDCKIYVNAGDLGVYRATWSDADVGIALERLTAY